MTDPRSDYFLAIESAVGGGSIALFNDRTEIDRIVGPSSVSRAEDLLPNIDRLLRANNIDKTSIARIVVGAGPGSFTGIRIGIATARGLSAAMNIPVRLLSTLEAIAVASDVENELTVGLTVGRETICVQSFERQFGNYAATSIPEPVSNSAFLELLQTSPLRSFVVNRSLYESMSSEDLPNLIDAGENLAGILGLASTKTDIADVVEPLFIGKRK